MIDTAVEKTLWWLGLVAAPAVLIAIELFHPQHFTAEPGMYQFLSRPEPFQPRFAALAYPGPNWWFLLHVVQTPMIGLVAVGLWRLVAGVGDADGRIAAICAWVSRAASLVFLIYYTALDSAGGTGLGRLILGAQRLMVTGQLTAAQEAGIERLLNAYWVDPWVGGVGSAISETGSWAAFAASLFAAAALRLARRAPWPAVVLLAVFGWQIGISHASPHGPIAFAALIAGVLWLRFSRSDRAVPLPP